jgi:hypothetical protein
MRFPSDARILRAAVIAVLVSLSHSTASEAAVHLGVQGGIQAARLTYDLDGMTFSDFEKYEPTGSIGVQVLAPLEPRFELETGLRYIEYVNDFHETFVTTVGTAQFHVRDVWRYLAVPAVFRFHPLSVPGLFLGGGGEGSYLMTISSSYDSGIAPAYAAQTAMRSRPSHPTGPVAQIFEGVGTFGSLNSDYSKWNFALNGVAGVDFALGGHAGEVQFRYTHGLVDIAKSDALKRETRGFEGLLSFRW